MSPVAQFARDHLSPDIRDLGFTLAHGTFRRIEPDGYAAVIQLRSHRLGEYPLEMLVDEGIVIPSWSGFLRFPTERVEPLSLPEFNVRRADPAESPLRRRLRSSPDLHGDLWGFDPERDLDSVRRFRTAILADAEQLATFSRPDRLDAELRAGLPNLLGMHPLYPRAAVHIVVLADLGRLDEAADLLSEVADWMGADDMSAWLRAKRATSQ